MVISCHVGRKVKEPLPANYMSGEFVYASGLATFYDCATGMRYQVAVEADYPAVERQYEEHEAVMGERIGVTLRGHIVYRRPMDGSEGERVPTLVVDALIGFAHDICDGGFLLSGVYQSEGQGIRSLLRLRNDYTFTETSFASDGSEITREGTWGCVSRESVALDYADPEIEQALFAVIPSRESLVSNGRQESLVYRKIYM